MLTTHNIDIQAFYDFCGFWSVAAVNTVYINCSFFTFFHIAAVPVPNTLLRINVTPTAYQWRNAERGQERAAPFGRPSQTAAAAAAAGVQQTTEGFSEYFHASQKYAGPVCGPECCK